MLLSKLRTNCFNCRINVGFGVEDMGRDTISVEPPLFRDLNLDAIFLQQDFAERSAVDRVWKLKRDERRREFTRWRTDDLNLWDFDEARIRAVAEFDDAFLNGRHTAFVHCVDGCSKPDCQRQTADTSSRPNESNTKLALDRLDQGTCIFVDVEKPGSFRAHQPFVTRAHVSVAAQLSDININATHCLSTINDTK